MPSSATDNLAVPTPSRPSAGRTASTSSIGRTVGKISSPFHSREASSSSLPGATSKSGDGRLGTAPPPNSKKPSDDDVRSGMATVTAIESRNIPSNTDPTAVTTLYAGERNKPFEIHTDLLISRSPYFKSLLTGSRTSASSQGAADPFHYPNANENAFKLFTNWLYGAKLSGPSDFNSMRHYLCLYLLAQQFKVEQLANETMDWIRHYYRGSSMTAPAYRLEYLYEHTEGPGPMRQFLTSTAAYRVLCEKDADISDSIASVLRKGGDFAVDFAKALATLQKNGLKDARRGANCPWHTHDVTPRCKDWDAQVYEKD